LTFRLYLLYTDCRAQSLKQNPCALRIQNSRLSVRGVQTKTLWQ